jgi:hypothetical protein
MIVKFGTSMMKYPIGVNVAELKKLDLIIRAQGWLKNNWRFP